MAPARSRATSRRLRRVPAREAVAAELEHVAAPDRGLWWAGPARCFRRAAPPVPPRRGAGQTPRGSRRPPGPRPPVRAAAARPDPSPRSSSATRLSASASSRARGSGSAHPDPSAAPQRSSWPVVGTTVDREPQVLGLFHGLVPPQNAPPRVDHDGTSRCRRYAGCRRRASRPRSVPRLALRGSGCRSSSD